LEKLEKSDMPKLWVPDKRSVFLLDAWPTLATGKVDLVKAKESSKVDLDRLQVIR
jgi:hypothetical protein